MNDALVHQRKPVTVIGLRAKTYASPAYVLSLSVD